MLLTLDLVEYVKNLDKENWKEMGVEDDRFVEQHNQNLDKENWKP